MECIKRKYTRHKVYDFAVTGINYITLREQTCENITVPKDFVFDGVSVPAPFTLLFSNKDLRQGIKAACFHDYMCQHKDIYTRKQATDILMKIWKENGLNAFKATVAKATVNVYQFFNGWK